MRSATAAQPACQRHVDIERDKDRAQESSRHTRHYVRSAFRESLNSGPGEFRLAGNHWETIRMDSSGKMLPEEIFSGIFAPEPPPPLHDRLTPRVLREAIATVLERVSANDLAHECIGFGLSPQGEDEQGPWQGKYRYVERRIEHWALPELLALGRRVADVYDDDPVLNHLLGLDVPGGVRGEMKNLIFAADGPKPRIVLSDAINNDLKVVGNIEHCLVYDRPLADTGPPGVSSPPGGRIPATWRMRRSARLRGIFTRGC